MKYGTDLSISGHQERSQGNWSSSQAGQMLAICLDRPTCEHDEHDSWDAFGGTTVGKKTALRALCKADFNCPAGIAVHDALLRAQHRFSVENVKQSGRSDRTMRSPN